MTSPIESAIDRHARNLAFTDGDQKVTYAELGERIDEFSQRFLRHFDPGQQVAWCPRNDLESLVTFWALHHSRLVVCPISFRIPEERRPDILRQLDATWLNRDSREQTGRQAEPFQASSSNEDQTPATLILSSGSTGQPKAVVHSMAAHVASAEGAASNMPLTQIDRWLWSLPLFHVSGLSILVRCAVAGATVVGTRHDRPLGVKELEEAKVTHLSVVSTQLRRLLEEPAFPNHSLKWVLLGGSSVDPRLVTSARERGINVLTTYGLTETASQVSTSSNDGDPSGSGKVLPNRELKIDQSGEILVRGKTLCLGYYRNGKIHSVVNDDGWFPTRDLGSMDESGQLFVRGRIDNMFVSGGENIYPESIERAIKASFDVDEAVVIPKRDPEFGARPVVFVSAPLPQDWQSTLRAVLHGFEIPVTAHDLPFDRTQSLKVNRHELEKLLKDD